MNNFGKELDENSKEKGDNELEEISVVRSNGNLNEKTDEISEEFSKQNSAENNNNNKNANDVILEQDILAKKEYSLKSKRSEEELLKRQSRDLHRNQIEASLYVAGRPLSIEELSTNLEIPKKKVEKLIQDIASDYLERSTALAVNQIGEKFQMALKPEYVEKASKFAKGGAIAEKYLRTLTIIALKQPILKSMVVKLRGSGAYEHIKYLLDNDLISAIKKGRSQELTTTYKYSEMFGLPNDKEEMKKVMIAQLELDEK